MAFDDSIDFELFRYTPSQVPAGIFAGLFFLTTAAHLYQIIKTKAWYFIPFVVGGIFQIIGYLVRIPTHDNKESVGLFSLQAILILLAPPLYAASIYMVLGRLITSLEAEKLSVVRVKWMTKIFVAGDVVAFLMQAAGAGIMSTGTVDNYEVGENVTVGGLGVQLAFFGFFMISCAIFHHRIRKNPTPAVSITTDNSAPFKLASLNWESILVALYAASVLILVRSIFRLVEYIQGNDGYLISHEYFMYIFDSTLMFLTMVVLNVAHPGVVLGRGSGGQAGKQRDVEMSGASSLTDSAGGNERV
ncbi:RTA1 like protein [Aspergillus karnatakaensis]|uniref:RTA1 domain-containing protein n=1 Tax=Aspergillus karnatakaensis TaxID=1810916 RepID=UPI003CCDEAE5